MFDGILRGVLLTHWISAGASTKQKHVLDRGGAYIKWNSPFTILLTILLAITILCRPYLPFGLCSAPYIFNQLSDALEWILKHNYGLKYVIHILDNYYYYYYYYYCCCCCRRHHHHYHHNHLKRCFIAVTGSKAYRRRGKGEEKLKDDGKDEFEVEFIKCVKLDREGIKRMQRPPFKLDAEDTKIILGAILTDKHISIAQNTLHHQFPDIGGFLSTTLGMVNQFLVIRTNVIWIVPLGLCKQHWLHISKFRQAI